MEPYASQLSGSSLGQPLYDGQKRRCTKSAAIKVFGALISVLLLAAAVGLGLYFVGDDEDDGNTIGGNAGADSGSESRTPSGDWRRAHPAWLRPRGVCCPVLQAHRFLSCVVQSRARKVCTGLSLQSCTVMLAVWRSSS